MSYESWKKKNKIIKEYNNKEINVPYGITIEAFPIDEIEPPYPDEYDVSSIEPVQFPVCQITYTMTQII